MTAPLLLLASLAFIASMLAGLGAPSGLPEQPAQSLLYLPEENPQMSTEAGGLLLPILLSPGRGALIILLIVVLAAVAIHVGRVLALATRPAASETKLSDHTPMIVALLAGAALPFLWAMGPLEGFAAALVMMLGGVIAIVRGYRHGAHVMRLTTVGLFAGWALMVAFAGFSDLLVLRLETLPELAVVVALVLAVGAAMAVQSRIGGMPSFSVAVIWALLGLAAVGLETEPVLAIAAILGIAAMTLVLVRAAT